MLLASTAFTCQSATALNKEKKSTVEQLGCNICSLKTRSRVAQCRITPLGEKQNVFKIVLTNHQESRVFLKNKC